MPYLDKLFGRKKPTVIATTTELAKVEADLQAAPARIARAEAALRHVADMNDEDHAAAEAELAAARRAEVRLTAQAEQLRAAHDQAVKDEAAAALRARAAAAQKAVDGEHMKLIARYEIAAAELAEIAKAIAAIDDETDRVNEALATARRDMSGADLPLRVVSATERFRNVPEHTDPDQVVEEEQWGSVDERGRWIECPCSTYVERNGRKEPMEHGYQRRIVKRAVPGKTHARRVLKSPAIDLYLPPARLDAPAFWPKPL